MLAVQINEKLLDEKLAQLEEIRSWSPRVISKLETMIRTADDYALFRINPVQYALDKGIAENEAIALFLYATKVGLFELEWHLVCPSCGHLVENLRSMDNLHSHYVCNMCYAEVEASLDDYIQVTFTLRSELRDLIFHHPEVLSIEDFYFKYHLCKALAPFQGQKVSDVLLHFTSSLTYLLPYEHKTIELELSPGLLRVSDLINNTLFAFAINPGPNPDPQVIPVKLDEGKFCLPDKELLPVRLDTPNFTFEFEQFGEINKGKIVLDIENLTDRKGSIWAVYLPPDFSPPLMEFENFLSGKKLLTNQTFRDLFRSEVVQSPEGLGVKDITFLFTDLKGSTELYDLIGDPKAYYLVRQHFDTLGRVIADHSGSIVKTIGDAVMATFMNPVDAVGAAVDMLEGLETLNRSIAQPLILKIGIHRGHSIVVTLNDRLDYFGQNVNIAARVQGLAGAGEICVSREVYTYPGVIDLLIKCNVVSEQALVKGVSEKIGVHKITH